MRHLALIATLAGTITCISVFAQIVPTTQQRQERLAKHAELFRYYSSARSLETAKPGADNTIDLSQDLLNDYADNPDIKTAQQELGHLAQHVDAIVEGTAIERDSSLNSQHSFVFSNWLIKVTKVFKNSSPTSVQVGDVIIVARPGGELTFQGRHVAAQDRSFPDFAIHHDYILYLLSLPETSSFRSVSGEAFDVTGSNPLFIVDPGNKATRLRSVEAGSVAELVTAIERSVAQ